MLLVDLEQFFRFRDVYHLFPVSHVQKVTQWNLPGATTAQYCTRYTMLRAIGKLLKHLLRHRKGIFK